MTMGRAFLRAAARAFGVRRTKQKLLPAARVLARVGFFSIGTIYILIGVWAMLALLRVANPAADEQRIMHRMTELPLGIALIAGLALGMFAYVLWLIFEAVFDPYKVGNRLEGVGERVGVALSALAYGKIASAAVTVLLGGGAQGEEERQRIARRVLEWPAGPWLVGAAGLVVGIVGLFQIKYVYDGGHWRQIEASPLGRPARIAVEVLGWAGYGARCAILLVLGWFLLHAAWSFDPKEVGDTDSAFNFLGLGGGALGNALFSAVAFGTIAYGLSMYVNGLCFTSEPDSSRARPLPRRLEAARW
jgi:hypothetical protein